MANYKCIAYVPKLMNNSKPLPSPEQVRHCSPIAVVHNTTNPAEHRTNLSFLIKMAVRNVHEWYKLAFKLLVSDQWDVIAERVENGDQCYRWVKEQLLVALHDMEKDAWQKPLASAALGLSERLKMLRSPSLNEEEFLGAQHWLEKQGGMFALRDESSSVPHRVRGAKVALLEAVFVHFDKPENAGGAICSVFTDLCMIDAVVEAIYENKDPQLAAEVKVMFDCAKEYAATMKIPVDDLVELEFDPSCLPSDPPAPFKPPEIWVFGDLGNEDGFLSDPVKIQVDKEGNYLVMDNNTIGVNVETVQRIQLFDPLGKFVKVILKRGDGKVNGMDDFCLNKDGNLVVVDQEDNDKNRLQVFDYDANQLMVINIDDGPDSAASIREVFVDDDGNMICPDIGESCIRIYGPDGKLRIKFGSWGMEEGQFRAVCRVTAQGGKIYAFDNGVDKVETVVFDYDGQFLSKFDTGIQHWQLVFDEKNQQFYVIQDDHSIEILALDATSKKKIGAFGYALNEFWFPSSLVILDDGRIAVADKSNNRIKVFKP